MSAEQARRERIAEARADAADYREDYSQHDVRAVLCDELADALERIDALEKALRALRSDYLLRVDLDPMAEPALLVMVRNVLEAPDA